MINLLDALRALGGESHSSVVYQWMEEQGIARKADLVVVQKDGGTRFRKEVRFARKELFDAGMIENGGPGEWYLTATGQDTHLTHASANEIVRLNQKLRPLRRAQKKSRTQQRPVARRRQRRTGPTTGPRPVSWSRVVSHDVLGPAYTYIMQFGNSSVWKVGKANDVHHRLVEVNKHIPFELLNAEWAVVDQQEWPNSVLAHAMEQEVFTILHSLRKHGERLTCPKEALVNAWIEARHTVEQKASAPSRRQSRAQQQSPSAVIRRRRAMLRR
jgi:hypothetical protein